MLSLFNVLRFPLVVLPKALRCVSEAMNATRNLEGFLAQAAAPKHDEEGAPGGRIHKVGAWVAALPAGAGDASQPCLPHGFALYSCPARQLAASLPRAASVAHPSLTPHSPSLPCAPLRSAPQAVLKHGDHPFELRIPEFTVNPGELVAVVGRVGSGKSSLLQALLGNMKTVEGSCSSGGKISYVPQTAWCQNLTLQENIVFGQPWDEARYKQVGWVGGLNGAGQCNERAETGPHPPAAMPCKHTWCSPAASPLAPPVHRCCTPAPWSSTCRSCPLATRARCAAHRCSACSLHSTSLGLGCLHLPPAQHAAPALALNPPNPSQPLHPRPQAGLRGINLSGGQRQRLNLARSAYFGGDLVLLDNALSAVDHHTAHHIFEHCVKGMFRDKATVLVTHQVGLEGGKRGPIGVSVGCIWRWGRPARHPRPCCTHPPRPAPPTPAG